MVDIPAPAPVAIRHVTFTVDVPDDLVVTTAADDPGLLELHTYTDKVCAVLLAPPRRFGLRVARCEFGEPRG